MQTCENDGLSANNPKKNKKQKADSTSQQAIDARIINNLIKESLNKFAEESRAKVYKEECAQAVIAVLAEFLQNYILIGYDFEGTNIKIVKANTSLEADALITALQKFVMQMQINNNDV